MYCQKPFLEAVLLVVLCKKCFAAFGGERFFGQNHLFLDFAKQNQEKDDSVQM